MCGIRIVIVVKVGGWGGGVVGGVWVKKVDSRLLGLEEY